MAGKRVGKWFEGDVFRMSSLELSRVKKFSRGVMKPTAFETKILDVRGRKGKPPKRAAYSRYIYKPIGRYEFWD